ncbi:amidase [Paludibacterium purpuratum]|uniref:Amidase/aspartyl-tRNA(Asn)/glutamyl-tRNA(Gln) amidotransferase subunit A/fatty acid amide hydrolase 2 n=1 Tax=Paludibacterium purpuratum TaxID=1144873 RepID=A0A4R7AZ63_9NEIS|nr:amidase [Paludibacterium purpuratum]TDR72012.1 amidase/aspartyl-tRNA(Asn)/glutamyl-tRNA(Gln) amidotransferase subunit A/fatty acid amide hydrolase 2 [Paludibacterium purpuratum]
MSEPLPRELADATILLQQMAQGTFGAEKLLHRHLMRLGEVQPLFNAASCILRDEARQQCDVAQPGPLAGLPCSVKETLGMAGQPIHAGSNFMRPLIPAQDSTVVARLKAAGALIVARGNVPEFAMTAETSSPRHGITRNPLAPDRVAGGSSGGDAALVASGAVAFGVGSDILGSIRIPAACCGVVGFKPASTAVPKQGAWPQIDGFTDSWLAIGPLTRSVRDARLVYQVLAQVTLPAVDTLSGLRLIEAADFPLKCESPCIDQALHAARAALLASGMRQERQRFDEVVPLYDLIAPMILHDMQADWYRALNSGDRTFRFLAEAWRQIIDRPGIDRGLFMWLLYGATFGRFSVPKHAGSSERLIGRFQTVRELYRTMLGDDGILLLPTMGMLAPAHGEMNRRSLRPGLNQQISPLALCNYADLPAIAVPAWSFADPATGLPPSLMLVAAPGNEARLLAVAEAVEQRVNPPRVDRTMVAA